MNLIETKKLNTTEIEESITQVIESLSQEFNGEDMIIKYWRNEECREHGISHIYSHDSKDLQGMIHEARKLIDRDCFASAEVIAVDECGEEETVYFYDGVEEQILFV